jgi:hypothetical protein
MKAALDKTIRVGRTTVLLAGLAVILALVFGATSQALAGKKGDSASRLSIDVQSDGTGNDKVATSSKLRTGVYLVKFKRQVNNCHRAATLGSENGLSFNADTVTPTTGEIQADSAFRGESDESDKKLIMVTTRDSAGTLEDKSFHLTVFC